MSGNQEMAGSWRYLTSAGSKLSSLKGYIARDQPHLSSFRATPPSHDARNVPTPEAEERQGFRAWAGQKIRARRRTTDELNTEVVNIFPGWAARRYAASSGDTGSQQFEVEVSVSGYAVSCRPPEQATRSQRAFIRLAKGFASLPKLVEDPTNPYLDAPGSPLLHLTPSTEALLAQVQLPPRPDEIADDFNVEELERRLQKAKQASTDTLGRSANGIPPNEETNDFEANSESSSTDDLPRTLDAHPRLQQASIAAAAMPIEVLRRLHANLEQRLQPFWSSALPNRSIELRLFASPHQSSPSSPPSSAFASSIASKDGTLESDVDTSHGPLDTLTVMTAADGSFTAKFIVPWEKLCEHPLALYIAFGETVMEHDVVVVAQLAPSSPSVPLTPQSSPQSPYGTYQSPSHPNPSSAPSNKLLTTVLRVPITHSPIRVVSDIDDTIKFSDILSGAKAVFHNVFVKDVVESVIPGMGEWYTSMWQRGVRFHYVSNGPFEMIAILNEFFRVSEIPPGSIKLKSYAGRSLFSGLLSAPAARKRAGVVDILDSFPDSRFFLIGDTGEQDLELYADLAKEKPDRILGVFVRDVDTGEYDPLDDPTGWQVVGMGAAGSRPDGYPLVPKSETGENPMTPTTTPSSPSVEFEQRNYEQLRTQSEPAPPPYSDTVEFQTPKPNRYTTQGAHMTTEPESIDSPTPTMGSYPRVDGGPQMEHQEQNLKGRAQSQPQTPLNRQGPYTPGGDIRTTSNASFITEPPKPNPPPSITSSVSGRLQSKLRAKLQNSACSLSNASLISGSESTSSSMSFRRKGLDSVSPEDKKRQDLQDRVYKARTQMPGQVVLRIFRDPKECVEAEEILGREGASKLLGGNR